MGNETSTLETNMPPVNRRNNFIPLRFHQVHGENVTLSCNDTLATRSEGFAKAIVFSDRPVVVNEPVYVRLTELAVNWSGALRIGLTAHDPVSMKSKLPRYACPDLTSIPGNWAKAVPEGLVKKDSILYYYFEQNGDVYYGIDKEEYGVFISGVKTGGKLWAVIDIYGNTLAIQFADPSTLFQRTASTLVTNETVVSNENDSSSIEIASANLCHEIWFHSMTGTNIRLLDNNQKAKRMFPVANMAYIFLERHLYLGEKFAIEVLDLDPASQGKLMYGVTSCDPATLTPRDLPENVEDLLDRSEYWIVKSDNNTYEKGDYISISTNPAGEVILMKNFDIDFRPSYFYVDSTQKLWFFLFLVGAVTEVGLVGSTKPTVPTDHLEDVTKQMGRMTVSSPNHGQGVSASSSKDHSSSECVICCEELVDCALYKCGHMCMCFACAQVLRSKPNASCPICRFVIDDVIKIYKSN